MKILLPLILFFSYYFLCADESGALTVKYDEKYYSPRGKVEKFDVILPKNSKQKYYFIKLKRVFTLGTNKVLDNFERTFAVNADGAIYLSLERKNGFTNLNIAILFEEKQDINWGINAPKCRERYCYARKCSKLDYGQEAVIANYTNKREAYKSEDYYTYVSVSPDNQKKTRKFNFKVYLSFIKKPKDNNYSSLIKDNLRAKTKKGYDFPKGYLNKLSKKDLIKLRDKIMQEREAGLEELARDRATPEYLWHLNRKYYEVVKAFKRKEQNLKPEAQ